MTGHPLPSRKQQRLPDYDYRAEGAYFITICTKNRHGILSRVSVGTSIARPPALSLTAVGAVVEKAILGIAAHYPDVFVDHYVIMPNHVHLLIRKTASERPSLGVIIQQMKGSVTKQLGEQIWQNKYYDHIIRDEKDYLTRANYIAENPARWVEDEYYLEP